MANKTSAAAANSVNGQHRWEELDADSTVNNFALYAPVRRKPGSNFSHLLDVSCEPTTSSRRSTVTAAGHQLVCCE